MGLTVFLTTLIFPFIIAPQISVPASWDPPVADTWQPSVPVRFVRQVYAQGVGNVCQLNYCFASEQGKLEVEFLARAPKSGFFILVDVSENREFVFKDGRLLLENLVSTGSLTRFKVSYYTPIGEWQIVEKRKTDASGEFGPYFLRLGKWDGKQFTPTSLALHGTKEPEFLGKPASHGCIRHSNEAISHLYAILPIGTIVETVE